MSARPKHNRGSDGGVQQQLPDAAGSEIETPLLGTDTDLPPNIREILKRQPYVVVERDTEEARIKPRVMHLTDGLRSLRNRTLCGVRYSRATHVPLTSWGNPDCEWCRNCMYSAKNSVKNQLKAQFTKAREAAKNVDPENGSAGAGSS